MLAIFISKGGLDCQELLLLSKPWAEYILPGWDSCNVVALGSSSATCSIVLYFTLLYSITATKSDKEAHQIQWNTIEIFPLCKFLRISTAFRENHNLNSSFNCSRRTLYPVRNLVDLNEIDGILIAEIKLFIPCKFLGFNTSLRENHNLKSSSNCPRRTLYPVRNLVDFNEIVMQPLFENPVVSK